MTFGDGWYFEEALDTAVCDGWEESPSRASRRWGERDAAVEVLRSPRRVVEAACGDCVVQWSVLERFGGFAPHVDKTWKVTPRQGQPNELIIETDEVLKPPAIHVSWGAAADAGLASGAMIDFRSAPEPLSPLQRVLVADATVIVLAIRIWGLARSPGTGRDPLLTGDARLQRRLHILPPQGIPLFIGAAKLLRFAGLDDFRSLGSQRHRSGAVDSGHVSLLPRASFSFLHVARGGPGVRVLPNVWFFGETAFSDVPAVVLVLLACAFLREAAGARARC